MEEKLELEEYIRSANFALEQGRLEEARQILLKANSSYPDHQKVQELLEHTQRSIRQEDFQKLVQQGKDLFAQGHLKAAKTKLETALLIAGDDEVERLLEEVRSQIVEAEFDRCVKEGKKYLQAGIYEEAKPYFDLAFQLKPDEFVQKALKTIEEKISLASYALYFSEEKKEKGQWQEAKELLQKALKEYPENQDLLLAMALLESYWEEYRELHRKARRAERRLYLILAWRLYRELLGYSPQCEEIHRKISSVKWKLAWLGGLIGILFASLLGKILLEFLR
ncbi:MAG: hypothetical protein D6805_09215 [Planctomycetota bacterium]|nr:MAG: hypothetical protein D6805_09215 [Planctomycetota bacterium]